MLKIYLADTKISQKNRDEFLESINKSIIVTTDDRMKSNYLVYILCQDSDFGNIAEYIEDSCMRGKRILSCIIRNDWSSSLSDIHNEKLNEVETKLFHSLTNAIAVAKNNSARHFISLTELVEFLNQTYQILEENKNV